MTDKIMGVAKVTCEVEVVLGGGGWGSECTVAQIYKQAADQAENRLHQLRREGIKLVGKPQVTAVLFPENKVSNAAQ